MASKNKIHAAFKKTFKTMGISKEYLEKVEKEINLPRMTAGEKRCVSTRGLNVRDISEAIKKGVIERRPPNDIFLYKKRPIFLYMRDQFIANSSYNRGTSSYKFHLCYCQWLKEADESNLLNKRYVVTNRADGTFLSNVILKDCNNERHDNKELLLQPCRYCLGKINWQNYEFATPEGRTNIVETFNIKEYLAEVSEDVLAEMQETTKGLHNVFSLPKKEYWLPAERKKALKSQCGYRCQKCHKQFKANELQIHHRNHNEGDNSPDNLMVLCTPCHRAVHDVEGGRFPEQMKK